MSPEGTHRGTHKDGVYSLPKYFAYCSFKDIFYRQLLFISSNIP